MTTRRRFLETVGGGLTGGLLTRGGVAASAGSWLARGLPLAAGAAVLGWPRRAEAAVVLDPVPDPFAAGWTKEGPGVFTVGTPLVVIDGGTGPGQFCNLFAAADFSIEQLLTPRVSVGDAFVEDPTDGNLGVHVTFNDGVSGTVARAVLLKAGPGKVRVAVARTVGYSNGFVFPGLVADFEFRRKVNGDVTLRALGQPEEPTLAGQLPPSTRPGTTTFEFGTYDVPASSTSQWNTLGLPPAVIPVSIKIKPGSDEPSINLASAGVIPVAILSSPTFDATQVVPTSVSLAGAKVRLIGKAGRYSCSFEDVNGDGRLDLMCHVETASFFLETGESMAVLEAETFDGRAIRGQETVRIVP